jgi:hypothetical protein
MRKTIRMMLAISMSAVSALGGCATGGMTYAEMHSPSAGRGFGRIYFYRSGVPFGLAVQPNIKINGETVGSAVPNGFFFVDRPPGKYEITAATEVEEKVTVTLMAGETKYIQFYLTPGVLVSHANLNPVSREKAEEEMKELHQTGVQ